MNRRSPRLAEARPFGVQLKDVRGAPMLAADIPVTPIARRLTVWWPGGAWVYAWPGSIEYPDGSRIRQIRIVPIQSLASVALVALALATIAASFAQRWRDGQRDTGESASTGGKRIARTWRGEQRDDNG
ncbi:MAG: hypothetical protein ACXWQR_22325 [Ktedonobacterales bacterium]